MLLRVAWHTGNVIDWGVRLWPCNTFLGRSQMVWCLWPATDVSQLKIRTLSWSTVLLILLCETEFFVIFCCINLILGFLLSDQPTNGDQCKVRETYVFDMIDILASAGDKGSPTTLSRPKVCSWVKFSTSISAERTASQFRTQMYSPGNTVTRLPSCMVS